MKGQGLRREREMVILFNEEEATASVWTASEAVYRRLRRLGYVPSEDNERSATFDVPKREVRLPRPRRGRAMSEEQRERMRKVGQQLGKGRSRSRSKEIPLGEQPEGAANKV